MRAQSIADIQAPTTGLLKSTDSSNVSRRNSKQENGYPFDNGSNDGKTSKSKITQSETETAYFA